MIWKYWMEAGIFSFDQVIYDESVYHILKLKLSFQITMFFWTTYLVELDLNNINGFSMILLWTKKSWYWSIWKIHVLSLGLNLTLAVISQFLGSLCAVPKLLFQFLSIGSIPFLSHILDKNQHNMRNYCVFLMHDRKEIVLIYWSNLYIIYFTV